ncbi:MAG: hypothetical protein GY823_09835, partial [Flavobacteriaceae bacterium]|nr:hypothetical protein [Flavobacteriaceae bacterium]
MGYESTTGEIERKTIIRQLIQDGNGTEDNEWNHYSGPTDLRPLINDSQGTLLDSPNFRTTIQGTIKTDSVVGDGDITLEVTVRVLGYAGTEIKHTKTESLSSGDDFSLSFTICTPNYQIGKQFAIETKIIADTTISSYTPSLVITKTRIEQDGIFETDRVINVSRYSIDSTLSSINNLNYINPQLLMPDMKIIDFLSDIFKTYNLVAFEERLNDNSYLINVKPLDKYYDDGVQYDITPYVDISETTVSRISPYNTIEYKFSEPKTFLAINQSQVTRDDWGNMDFNANNIRFAEEDGDIEPENTNSFIFDGGNYKVSNGFEKMMFERISGRDYRGLTDIQWGWFVEDNKGDNFPNPTLGKPLLHYAIKTEIDDSYEDADRNTITGIEFD